VHDHPVPESGKTCGPVGEGIETHQGWVIRKVHRLQKSTESYSNRTTAIIQYLLTGAMFILARASSFFT